METATINTLSGYQIAWIEFRPAKGITTKQDIKRIMGRSACIYSADSHTKALYAHFPTMAKASEFLASKRGVALSKAYECRVFTDKQFGMRSSATGYAVPFTAKQDNEKVLIG